MPHHFVQGQVFGNSGRRGILKWLFGLMIAESFFYKSILEELLGSTLLHYVLSTLLCLILVLVYITSRRRRYWPGGVLITLTVVLLVAWPAAISLVHPPVLENSLAAAFFGILVVTFFIIMPMVAELCGIQVWRAVYIASVVAVVVSIAALSVYPAVTIDEEAGRFRGVLVSTAVASNVFFFAVLFSAVSVYRARTGHSGLIHLLVLVASAICLVLTATRGAMAFAAIGLLWIGFWKPAPMVLHRIVAAVAAVAMIALGVVITSDNTSESKNEITEFLRWEQLSTAESRSANWLFGIERVQEAPILGEGFLSKYTAGGTEEFGGISTSSYDQLYDPHSLVLYLMIIGGIPMSLITLGLVVVVWRRATRNMRKNPWMEDERRTLYMSTVILFALMVVNGGSLVSFGNLVDRVWWVLLGDLYLKSQRIQRA